MLALLFAGASASAPVSTGGRALLPATVAAMQSGAVALAALIEMQFLSGTLRLTTARVPIEFGASAVVTISGPGTAVVTWTGHPLLINEQVRFTSTGSLPTGLVVGTTYYATAAGFAVDSFRVSETPGGVAINTSSAGSGVHTANGEQVYVATGLLGAIDEIKDQANEIAGFRFNISGVDPAAIAIALGEQIRGRPLKLWLAILDADTHALLEAPLLWTGQLDKMQITRDKGGANISVSAEHRGVLFNRAKPIRYTNADQQRVYPGDRSLEYVISQSAAHDVWPAASFWRK